MRTRRKLAAGPASDITAARLIRQLNDSQGTTFIIVTHDLHVARQTRRVLVMADGKIVHQVTPGPNDTRSDRKGNRVVIVGSHGPMQPFQVVVRNGDHPITKGLPEKFMHVPDELYGWLRGPAENLTVLATAFAPKEQGGAGEHEPTDG